ncbi:isocitrate lyase/phosphoenolpyruvate mutase family protein [Amycolatopsis sp. FBCC-B4732]|uniref:isocitrate lyase/phosphoenolpyruvate mutase family protein n=1 Tax=Amycolatopsis sp. FBCC-B4732 TaxID=3079339 RepID=UPI001FF5888E|nr:isocitrate lyase/phosphoenolpyruvate mutase family protein [Amycolatopsis sp. FBCC-B4732]UOX90405.1 isocitrate lyase/phosphoenolpyruvate mutase family protein [Amycolatopsis sp. FBCC-B4732]
MTSAPHDARRTARGASALREAFVTGKLVRTAGAHDGLSARLAQEAGFDAVWASGLEISAAHGLPDVSLLGLAEYVAAALIIRRSVDIPVVADCDTGFGGNLNAAYTMTRYEEAGAAGICIEDKLFPKRNSFVNSGQKLLETDEFCRKLEVAKRAQAHLDTVLVARTEAFICGMGLQEALTRCHRYVDAGADAVLVHSKDSTCKQIVSFMRSWGRRAPVVIVPTTYTAFSMDEAREAGVSMIIYANQGMRTAIAAMRRAWATVLAEGSTESLEMQIASIDDLFAISGMHEWLERAGE